MEKLLGQSWLTTVIGLIGAILNALVPLFQDGTVDFRTLVNSAMIAAGGWAAKSWNVSGPPK